MPSAVYLSIAGAGRHRQIGAGAMAVDKGDKDKDKSKDKKTLDGAPLAGDEAAEPGDEDDGANLTREERKKKYMERADIQEALQIGADLAVELAKPGIKIGETTAN